MVKRNDKGQFVKGCKMPEWWIRKVERVKVKCKYCGEEIEDYEVNHRKYCNRKCFFQAHKGKNHCHWMPKLVQYCLTCGKRIILTPKDLEKGIKKFCNRKCYAEYQKGKSGNRLDKPCSEETKEILRKSHKGKHNSPTTEFKKGDSRITGANNWNWKDGISFEPYSSEFNNARKEYVRKRDGHICQLCGKTQEENGRKLSIHHIDYDKKNCNPKNLISLCIACNTKVNSNREYWMRYFQRKMEWNT